MLRLKTQMRVLLDNEMLHGAALPVLLLGPSGSGKCEAAQALHFEGPRRDRPLVFVDAEDLLEPGAEARLFGAEADASPGAPQPMAGGLMAAANGGTLFFSGLTVLSLRLQARLAVLLNAQALRQVAGARRLPQDVRFVFALQAHPQDLLATGHLLPALAAQCSPVCLNMPPLIDRGADLALLAHHFIEQAAQRRSVEPPVLSRAALELLAGHRWPGNLAELRHAMEHAVLLQNSGTVHPHHLPLAVPQRAQPAPLPAPLCAEELNRQRLERETLQRALQRAHGNVSAAARLLGISRDAMRFRLQRHRLADLGPSV